MLRHPVVSDRYEGRCYGRTNVGLGREGVAQARGIASVLKGQGFTRVIASPSRRARVLGARISAASHLPLCIDERLAERWFGCWEGRSWDEIWAAEGDAMNGMIDDPACYRPGGGETTAELADRVLDWFQGVAPEEVVAVATHGGPIAALIGRLRAEAPRQWLRNVPAPATGVRIEPAGNGWRITPWPLAATA